MKHLLKKLLLLTFLLFTLSASAQEELFGDNSGISLAYLQAIYEDAEPGFGVGFSAFVNRSIAISAGFVSNDGYATPVAGVGYFSKPDESFVRWYIGATYARFREETYVSIYTTKPHYYHAMGLSFGVFRTFFPTSNFPFAVTGSASGQTAFGSHNEQANKLIPTAGLHFTQGFFAKGTIYPFISLGFTHEFEHKINLYSASIGFNLKMNTKPKGKPKEM